jgi:hypothetical protein
MRRRLEASPARILPITHPKRNGTAARHNAHDARHKQELAAEMKL